MDAADGARAHQPSCSAGGIRRSARAVWPASEYVRGHSVAPMPEIRPVADDTAFALSVEVANAVAPDHAMTIDERRQIFDALPRNCAFLAYEDGVAVGTASGMFRPGSPHPTLRNLVLADARRRGAGRALYRAVSGWAAGEGATLLEVRADERDPAGIEFAQHRGFEELSREIQAILDLDAAEPPRATPPAGVEIVAWSERPAATPGLYEVYCEASPDIPGDEGDLESYEDWLALHMQGPGDRADATFVAVAAEGVVGYAKLSLTAAQPHVAYHDLTGVKRAWRGRGIARSLKATQIAWAKRAGYAQLVTGNEERNAPIRRLNERFGYRPGPALILFRGPLAS
jgi:GNAT superfamily N-acetyltransferase